MNFRMIYWRKCLLSLPFSYCSCSLFGHLRSKDPNTSFAGSIEKCYRHNFCQQVLFLGLSRGPRRNHKKKNPYFSNRISKSKSNCSIVFVMTNLQNNIYVWMIFWTIFLMRNNFSVKIEQLLQHSKRMFRLLDHITRVTWIISDCFSRWNWPKQLY